MRLFVSTLVFAFTGIQVVVLATSCAESQAPRTPADVQAVVEAIGKCSCEEILTNTREDAPSPVVQRARKACTALPAVLAVVGQ